MRSVSGSRRPATPVREAIAERQTEREAEGERARAMAREQADRLAIVAEIESLSGPEAVDRIAELKVGWDALAADAVGVRGVVDASLPGRLPRLRRSRAASDAGGGGRRAGCRRWRPSWSSWWPAISRSRKWWRAGAACGAMPTCLREHAQANPEAAARVEQAIGALEAKEAEHQQLRTRQEQDNLRRLQQIGRQIETLLASDQISLKAGDRALREIRAALEERAPLPSKQDRQEIQHRLEALRATLAPRVQELRDADEWQRWANLQVQEELTREMEGLKAEADLDAAGRKMRDLQSRWKQVALAPTGAG